MIYFPAEYFLTIYSLPPIAEVRFQKDYFSEYPQQIYVGSNRSAVSYTRHPGYYAIRYNQPDKVAPGAILQLNEGAISTTGYAYAIFSGEPNQSEKNPLSPVYTLEPNGSLAVPTGLVFIRFAEGVDVESQHEAINRAGYEIEQSLAYAPQAAWLRPKSGNIADAIAGISRLEAIPNVENVELQMLMERGLKLGR
ncbi:MULTISPECIES: hypothetical protein [Nostoc]|uniref:Uncharacterized protein n=1 Tax=Nostoc paludosum FACHB-159 TaxID=2692908 RepID=A0ABR8K280_9NOSO|nr:MULTISPECIES: hypothetical protein [Nostoc]MBD2677336.1 hypothetical protein [Nostoc sp. FACHB-857]MBD2732854.1 hypothetical protein [Nostoc paludosum FACHB-159]